MNADKIRSILRTCLIGWFCVLAVAGCEAIFTASPLSFLQRDPSKLPDEQKITWAEAALASGDEEAMADAYAAIADLAAGSSDPDLTYLAANLALELSGVPGVVDGILEDVDNLTVDENLLNPILSSVDAAYVAAAAGFFQDTMTNGSEVLTGTDMIMGSLCLAYNDAINSGTDFTPPIVGDFSATHTFIAASPLGADDQTAQDILTDIDGFLP